MKLFAKGVTKSLAGRSRPPQARACSEKLDPAVPTNVCADASSRRSTSGPSAPPWPKSTPFALSTSSCFAGRVRPLWWRWSWGGAPTEAKCTFACRAAASTTVVSSAVISRELVSPSPRAQPTKISATRAQHAKPVQCRARLCRCKYSCSNSMFVRRWIALATLNTGPPSNARRLASARATFN